MAGSLLNTRVARLEKVIHPPRIECASCGFPATANPMVMLIDAGEDWSDPLWALKHRCQGCGRLVDEQGRPATEQCKVIILEGAAAAAEGI